MADKILTQQELLALLIYCLETGIFTWRVDRGRMAKAGDIAGTIDNHGYLLIRINGKRYKAHRLAWLYVYGVWPPAEIDHINRVRADNRIDNLREASRSENNRNMSKASTNTSGHVGVSWCKATQKWRAQIMHEGRKIHLGRYVEQADAVAARRAGEIKYWGAARAE